MSGRIAYLVTSRANGLADPRITSSTFSKDTGRWHPVRIRSHLGNVYGTGAGGHAKADGPAGDARFWPLVSCISRPSARIINWRWLSPVFIADAIVRTHALEGSRNLMGRSLDFLNLLNLLGAIASIIGTLIGLP